MIASGGLAATIWLLANHEAWESVVFGGMIPILGALAVVWLLWWAVKSPEDEEKSGSEDPPPQ